MKCYLGLGSNLGSPERKLRQSIKALRRQLPKTQLLQVSPVYRSKALGLKKQPNYRNMALEVTTHLSPKQLLRACQKIEKNFGRCRKKRWGARTLDIDILFYGNRRIDNIYLKIPHPGVYERDFVLKPLMDLQVTVDSERFEALTFGKYLLV